MPETVGSFLSRAAKTLTNVDTGRLDAELLLAHALGRDRSWVLAHPEESLAGTSRREATDLVSRRRAGVPLAYLIGTKEFYGRPFAVTPAVLVPRPETEELVELVLREGPLSRVLDLGTGSGCIAVTIALEAPSAVTGSDISAEALQVARQNAASLDASVDFLKADLVPVGYETADSVIIANLPYVSDASYAAHPDLANEPDLALRAGPDGLDVLRQLFDQLRKRGWPRLLALEFEPAQTEAIQAESTGDVALHADLAGRTRFALIRN